MGGGGEGEVQYLNPKHSQFLKKEKKKTKTKKKVIFFLFFFDRAGIGTHDLRVRKKHALLSTRLNTIIAIMKYE